jgi:hypothetical protein
MTAPLGEVAAASLPVTAANAGGIAAAYRRPAKVRSGVQNFATGLVSGAAAATELVPDLSHEHGRIAIGVGFATGRAHTRPRRTDLPTARARRWRASPLTLQRQFRRRDQ